MFIKFTWFYFILLFYPYLTLLLYFVFTSDPYIKLYAYVIPIYLVHYYRAICCKIITLFSVKLQLGTISCIDKLFIASGDFFARNAHLGLYQEDRD